MWEANLERRLPSGRALTAAACLVRTVIPSSLHSAFAVQPRLVGNGVCKTVGPVSPDKDEQEVKGFALSLVYVAWFEGRGIRTGTRTSSIWL